METEVNGEVSGPEEQRPGGSLLQEGYTVIRKARHMRTAQEGAGRADLVPEGPSMTSAWLSPF